MSEFISQADTEFQSGNFEEASGLYAKALEELDGHEEGAEPQERAALLQKLCDSNYALNKFDDARATYAELVALQETAKLPAKDRVSALLKFARCLDKCDSKEEAKENFQAAYDLAKSSLSAKHFLRRSVGEAYVEWLRAQGDDPERLKELEEEFGIEPEVKENEKDREQEEVKPEDITAPQEGRVAREQEYHVMRSKITELKKKKRKKGAEEDAESAEKADENIRKKAEKTIDAKVSERKFLRKGDDKKDSDQRSTQRQKLRTTMSNKRDATSEEVQTFSTDSINTEAEQQFVSGTYPTVPTVDEQSQTRFAEAKQISEEVRAKFISKKPGRRLEEPEDVFSQRSTGKRGIDLTVKEETASTSESSRAFLRQSQAIRKASGEEEVAPDVEQLRETDRIVTPVSARMKDSLKLAPPLIGLLMLIAAGVLYFKFIGPAPNHTPAFVSNSCGRNYVTADGAVTLALNKGASEISGSVLHRSARTQIWQGTPGDEVKLLTGGFTKCRWLSVVPEGLKDDHGVLLYAMDAPERRIITEMNAVKEQAQSVFSRDKAYPAYDSEIPDGSYPNPFNRTTDVVSISSGVDERADEANSTELDKLYRKGEEFKNEKEHHPGSVHAVSVIAHPSHTAEGAYSWRTHCFYIRGYDRDNKLIPSSTAGEVYMITLKNGMVEPINTDSIAENYATASLCLTDGEPPRGDLIALKYLLIVVVLAAISVAIFQRQLMEAMKSTHKLNANAPLRSQYDDF